MNIKYTLCYEIEWKTDVFDSFAYLFYFANSFLIRSIYVDMDGYYLFNSLYTDEFICVQVFSVSRIPSSLKYFTVCFFLEK